MNCLRSRMGHELVDDTNVGESSATHDVYRNIIYKKNQLGLMVLTIISTSRSI